MTRCFYSPLCVPRTGVYTMYYATSMSWVCSSIKVKGQHRVLHAVPDLLLWESTGDHTVSGN